MTSQPVRSRVPLPEISSRAWEHPADKGALVALRRLKGFDTLIRKISGLFNERAYRLQFLGSAVRVDERQFTRVHTLLVEVATALDAAAVPELYVAANPHPHAVTLGMDKAFIVVTSGMVDLLDEEELRFVLGHELGHVLSGHALYQTMLERLIRLSAVLTAVPIGGLGIRAVTAALMEWSRKAELSADRAGLLATQDTAVAFRTLMKLASGGHLEDLDPTFNAITIGLDRPIIVVNSALVDLLDEDELRWVLAHELGHALSGHAVYRTILLRLLTLGGVLTAIPLGGLGFRMIVAALMEWVRKSELSADRAGLLATQDPAVAYRALMKLAGGGHLDDLDQTSFFEQGAEYDGAVDIRDSVLKLLLIERRSHPMPVSRASELRRWVDSGSYTAILAGEYPMRDTDDDAKVSEAAQEAAASYAAAFRDTQDTLGRLVHDAAGWMGSAKTWLDEQWRRRGDEDAS